jgi:hypothetical protein
VAARAAKRERRRARYAEAREAEAREAEAEAFAAAEAQASASAERDEAAAGRRRAEQDEESGVGDAYESDAARALRESLGDASAVAAAWAGLRERSDRRGAEADAAAARRAARAARREARLAKKERRREARQSWSRALKKLAADADLPPASTATDGPASGALPLPVALSPAVAAAAAAAGSPRARIRNSPGGRIAIAVAHDEGEAGPDEWARAQTAFRPGSAF